MLQLLHHAGSQRCRLVLDDGVDFGVSGEVIGVMEVVDKQAIELIECHSEVQPQSYSTEHSLILFSRSDFVIELIKLSPESLTLLDGIANRQNGE